MRSRNWCDVCQQDREDVKVRRTQYGKEHKYAACPECYESVCVTGQLLAVSHRKAVKSGRYLRNSPLRVLTPCE